MLRTESVPKSIPMTQARSVMTGRSPLLAEGRSGSRWSTLTGTVLPYLSWKKKGGEGAIVRGAPTRVGFLSHLAADGSLIVAYHVVHHEVVQHEQSQIAPRSFCHRLTRDCRGAF